MHLLADLYEKYRHARVLAGRDRFGLCVGGIIQQEFDYLLARGRLLLAPRPAHRRQIVIRQSVRRLAQELEDRFAHVFNVDSSQLPFLPFLTVQAPQAHRILLACTVARFAAQRRDDLSESRVAWRQFSRPLKA